MAYLSPMVATDSATLLGSSLSKASGFPVSILQKSHLLVQALPPIKNVDSDKLKTIEMIKPFMEKIIEELKLNVVDECSHQFQKNNYPYGATMIYLSSESHLSVHTFVDEGKITLDLFTCDVSLEDRNI